VPLAELVGEIRVLLASGEHGGREVEVEIEPGLTVLSDPDQLQQVLWNLILNAAQASPPGSPITVRGATAESVPGQPERVRIEVEDRGVGIPPEEIERTFEPFFTTKPKGTGLGLATVHRVIEAHGGDVALRSDVGKGTVVSITLEAAQAAT
jgi:two-component system sensor histidine kinase PilS (NtrC family)